MVITFYYTCICLLVLINMFKIQHKTKELFDRFELRVQDGYSLSSMTMANEVYSFSKN